VSFDIYAGDIVAFMGPSGCGKSTLLSIIGGWRKQDGGTVILNGSPCDTPGPNRPICFQADTAYDWLTTYENVAFGRKIQGRTDVGVRDLIREFGLDAFRSAYPRELSGGMRKRTELARVICAASANAVLLLDEAFASLDVPTRIPLHLLLRETIRERTLSAIVTTHDPREAAFVADRIIILTGRPSTVGAVVQVPFEQHRSATLLTRDDFASFHAALEKRLLEAVPSADH
jgi:NitT/TauT family transport system ATP-binding protein